MSALIRGNELELAACVGLVLGKAANQSTAYCLELLARKYMTTPTWSVQKFLPFDDKFVHFAGFFSLIQGPFCMIWTEL